MDERAKEAIKQGNHLFSKKQNLDSLWQEIALNFYPERADFTETRIDGEEYADHLYTSFPVIARRELGNLIPSALRPSANKWFSIHVQDEDVDNSDEERRWLEYATEVQWRAMYDSASGFVRATKQADHDFVAFGNAVVKFGPNIAGDGLLYRNYHLRDNAWAENAEGKIDCNHRNWVATAKQLAEHFPRTIHKDVEKAARKDPYKTFKCRHVVLPQRMYDYKSKSGKQFPYVSLYVDLDHETVLEEVGLNYFCYVLPRWHTIDGSAYGTSMATSVILPDGRTMQVITRTIREAGEKFVDPPMVAVGDAIRGDIALMAGGVTIADAEYDERLGDVLRPLTQDRSGVPIGEALAAALRADITSGFFLDKIQLPDAGGGDMTAFEVRRRIQEHIRAAAPIFEPIEQEYNDPLCEGTFQVLRDFGAFPVEQMPESLQGRDIQFSFRSPMADMAEQQEAETFIDVRDRILLPVAQFKPEVLEIPDWTTSTRDAMKAAGWKADWLKPEEAAQVEAERLEKQRIMQEGIAAIAEGGAAAQQGAAGAAALSQVSGE